MQADTFEAAAAAISRLRASRGVGRVCALNGTTIVVTDAPESVRLGDRVQFGDFGGAEFGEVVRLEEGKVTVLPDRSLRGVGIGDDVGFCGPTEFAPHWSWIGRVIDPLGRPMDGRPLLSGTRQVAIDSAPPAAYDRRPLGKRLETGLAVFNTLLPIVRGQRIGLFAGSGVGKSTLLADLARGVEADVVVLGLVGERGREIREFVDNVLGLDGMARSVVVAATSDQAPQIRRRCAWSAMAVAESFRDDGKHVLLLIDSVTRFAEAHREVALAAGESAALRGFPASTSARIAGLCERAGTAGGSSGDITAIFSVLVAGSEMEEPVADMLRGVLDGHVVLDREIAERGRFPAVDVTRSVSRSLPAAASAAENATINEARSLIGTYGRSEVMIQAGLYQTGSDPKVDRAIASHPSLEQFMTRKNDTDISASFRALRAAMTAGAEPASSALTDTDFAVVEPNQSNRN